MINLKGVCRSEDASKDMNDNKSKRIIQVKNTSMTRGKDLRVSISHYRVKRLTSGS